MKKYIYLFALIFTIGGFSQEKQGSFFGGFETNSQWYLNDTGLHLSLIHI
jgi:hypothetical protein